MAELVHQSGPSMEDLGLAYARTQDKEHALEMLRDFVAMGQVDVATRPEISNLKSKRSLVGHRGGARPVCCRAGEGLGPLRLDLLPIG